MKVEFQESFVPMLEARIPDRIEDIVDSPQDGAYEEESGNPPESEAYQGCEARQGQGVKQRDERHPGQNSSSVRRKAEPQLGRAADGIERRVDATFGRVERLRMLGNGVVPQTAARALVTLLDEFYG